MRRRIGLGGMILIIYAALFVMVYVVVPVFLPQLHVYGGYFPLFFFFPFIFGRRGVRRRNTNTTTSQSNSDDQSFMNTKDTADWERRNAQMYDEFGIPKRSTSSRLLYFVALAIILSAALILLVFRGYLPF